MDPGKEQARDRNMGSSTPVSASITSRINMKNPPQFPRKFNGFVKKFKGKTSGLNLGEFKDSVSYAISMPGGYHGKTLFHNGPDPDQDPVVASAEYAGNGLGYSSTISLSGDIEVEFKYVLGSLEFNFEFPVGPSGEPDKFQWQGTRATLGGKCKLTRPSTGQTLAVLDEGTMGMTLGTAFEFSFEEQALDGSLPPMFPFVAVFTGVRCWQTRKHIKYAAGTGSSVCAIM